MLHRRSGSALCRSALLAAVLVAGPSATLAQLQGDCVAQCADEYFTCVLDCWSRISDEADGEVCEIGCEVFLERCIESICPDL